MPSYDIGDIIKRLRKQKGISQEDLAYPIIDRATLSKIETGKATPHRKTLEFLLDRLGYDSNEYISHFLVPEDVEEQLAVDELNILLVHVFRHEKSEIKSEKYAKITALINQLENNPEYMSHLLNKQVILDAKARLAFNMEENDKAAALAKEALEIVVPNFNEKDIANYYLNRRCSNMINLLSMIYNEAKRYDEAINILYGHKTNADNTYKEPRIHARVVAPIFSNLARTFVLANKHQEAYDLCEEGIKVCHTGIEFTHYKAICWHQAKALFGLGKKEEYIEMSRKLYCAFDIYRQDATKEYIRKEVLGDTGVDIGG